MVKPKNPIFACEVEALMNIYSEINKLWRYGTIVGVIISISACSSIIWSNWKTVDKVVFNELPYANGKLVQVAIRSRSCTMCSSSNYQTETAFSDGTRIFITNDFGSDAEKIITKIADKEKWPVIDSTANNVQRRFSSARIFIPSIYPLFIIVSPWTYKANLKSHFAGHDLHAELSEFNDYDYNTRTYVYQYWPATIKNVFEVRTFMPKQVEHIKVLTKTSKSELTIPSSPGDSISMATESQLINFKRLTDGRVLVSFAKD